MLGDPTKLGRVVVNYAFRSLSIEEVFSSTKHYDDYSLEENYDLHRLDHINFSHPYVAIPPSQPDSVNDLHVHGPSCSFTYYVSYSFSRWVSGEKNYMWKWLVEY
jgi:hypothetical protein